MRIFVIEALMPTILAPGISSVFLFPHPIRIIKRAETNTLESSFLSISIIWSIH